MVEWSREILSSVRLNFCKEHPRLVNDVYAEVEKICNTGKDVWRVADPAKYEDYVINDTPSGGSGTTAVREADVAPVSVASIDVSTINDTFASRTLGEIIGTVLLFASDSPTGTLGVADTFYELTDESFDKTLSEFGALVGFSGTKIYLRVQNTTGTIAHYKLTFTHLAP